MAKLEQPYRGLRCNDCKTFFEDTQSFQKCPRCNGLLDTVLDEDALSEYSKRALENGDTSMWKFRMFLPIHRDIKPVTAGEGGTPLRSVRSYSSNVFVKDESKNPTGTFKDRGASVAVTRLSQVKIRRIVLASEGNAGCSFALYSQLARIRCAVYLPKQANVAKVQLSRNLPAAWVAESRQYCLPCRRRGWTGGNVENVRDSEQHRLDQWKAEDYCSTTSRMRARGRRVQPRTTGC